MKNQYFGDISDYYKYGLLRIVAGTDKMSLLVAWMLTPDDGKTDGKFTSYLQNSEEERRHDSALYDGIRKCLESGAQRGVHQIQKTGLLPGAKFYRKTVLDPRTERQTWFAGLQKAALGTDLVFLDPDNGIEVKSTPVGRKDSCKYVYWHEIEALWDYGQSLLIYQHFPRKSRNIFVLDQLCALRSRTPNSCITGFSTDRVLFLLALKPNHRRYLRNIKKRVQKCWAPKIVCWGPET